MKRFWLGAVLLTLLLAGGFWLTFGADCICAPASQALERAAEAVQQGHWAQAEKHAQAAREQWEENRDLLATFTDHEPMEEIEALFGALDIFLRQRDTVRFADCCARLTALTEAIAEAQAVSWWNVL